MNKTKEKIVGAIDLSVIKKEHANKWVALSANRKKLLAVGKTLTEVIRKSGGESKAVVMKVLPSLGYAPTTS